VIEAVTPFIAFLTGIILGVIFFGGLWWTVGKGLASDRPAVWFLGSLLLRTSIVLVGFYFVQGHHWQRLVLCLVGFIVGRVLVTRYTVLPGAVQSGPAKDAIHVS